MPGEEPFRTGQAEKSPPAEPAGGKCGENSDLADDAHGGGLAGLAQGVVPQDLGDLVQWRAPSRRSQDVAPRSLMSTMATG